MVKNRSEMVHYSTSITEVNTDVMGFVLSLLMSNGGLAFDLTIWHEVSNRR